MMTAQDIVTRARRQLSDTGITPRWSDAELLDWITDAQRAIVGVYPQANPRTVVVALVEGTKQAIADDCHAVLHITRNCGAAGEPGRAVRLSSRSQLDQLDPDWHLADADPLVSNYTVDPNDNVFYVYPPNDGAGHVEAIYSQIPAPVTALGDELALRDVYSPAIQAYVMAQCHMKDADYAAGQALAKGYLDMFQSLVGALAGAAPQADPNRQAPPSGSA